MKINSLADLYLEQIRDMHSCESQLIKALPKMANAANNSELKKAFEKHLEQTKVHQQRLDHILAILEKPAGRKVCAAAAGLIKEADEVIENEGDDDARDAGLICAAQKLEHYEIASYGCLRTYAKMLDREQETGLLGDTLEEEKHADVELTKLAMTVINKAAIA
jgi:ferritin-like metal-binding protein YciE